MYERMIECAGWNEMTFGESLPVLKVDCILVPMMLRHNWRGAPIFLGSYQDFVLRMVGVVYILQDATECAQLDEERVRVPCINLVHVFQVHEDNVF